MRVKEIQQIADAVAARMSGTSAETRSALRRRLDRRIATLSDELASVREAIARIGWIVGVPGTGVGYEGRSSAHHPAEHAPLRFAPPGPSFVRPAPRRQGWFSRHRYGLISLAVIVVALKVYLANHAKRSSADDDEPDVATTASAKKKTAASVPSAASAKPAPKAPPTPTVRAPVKAAPPKASASAPVAPSASPSATASAPPTEYGE